MKKTRLWLSVLIVMLFSCLLTAFTACGGKKKEDEAEIQLNHQTYSLDLHEQVQLIATTKNTEEAVTFQSSAPDVATVDESGLVKSVKVGKSTITAKVEDKSAACEITVTNSGTAPVLEVSLNTLGINKDAEFTVDASVTYKGEEVTDAVTYTWAVSQGSPSDLISLTPSADGKSAVVKGLEYGETSFDVSTVIWGVPLKQTVEVKICNTDISFDVSGYELCEGGYKATLALVATDDYETTSTPAVTVKNKGTVVSDAQITWTSDKEGIVSVKGGVISAVTAGEVVLTGSYDNNYFRLYVTVIRPEITLSGITVETTKATLTLAAGDTIEGTVSQVTIGDDTNVYDKTESGVISLKKDLLPKQATQLGEGKTIVVETEKAIYSVPASIYTQIIRTKQELADWGTLAKAANDNAKVWDGYFVLGNDIDFEGDEYRSFISWANTETLDCTSAGFKGVFDGKGHIIDDIVINPDANGGFIGMMYTSSGGAESGVLRNVAFTNAVSKGNGAFVVSSGGGKVSNVYVSLNELKGGRNPDRSGVFFTRDAVGWAARVTDCFVEIKSVEQDDYTFAIGAKHRRTGMIQNVYAVGYDKAFYELSDASWDNPADVYGAYADYADFLAEGIDFSGWDTDFWKVVDGIPYPKNLDESKIPEMAFTNLQATVSAKNRIGGTAVDLAGKKITLEGLHGTYEATVVGGKITVNDIIKGSYTAKIDGFNPAPVTVSDGEATIGFVYNGERLDTPINEVDYTFWWDETVKMTKGEMNLPEQYGQYQVKLGSNRQNHVITQGTYQSVVIDAMFSSSYGAYANTTGILLQFADGKGILLGFQDQNGIGGTNFKLTYRTDNESYKFGMTDTLTGWIGDEGELTDCKPMKQEWKDKFDSADGLRLTLIRNANVLLTYVDGTLVNTYALPAEYRDSACKVGFFSNWGACDIPFAIGGTLEDADVAVSGIDSLDHGTAELTKESYSVGDEIVLNITPESGYKATKVTVNGADKTSLLQADGTILLGYASGEDEYAIEITFMQPVTLNVTVGVAKMGTVLTDLLKNAVVTLSGANGEYRGTVDNNGSLKIENIYAGVYTVSTEGYGDVEVTVSADAVAINFEYDSFEGDGAYDVSNQNKANPSISIGKLDQAWAITKDKYDDVSVTATFKSSYNSYKGFMGIQLVFDDGNGVMLTFECMVNNDTGVIDPNNMKLCFGTDCWQKKFAISGNALTSWISVAEPLTSDMAAAFGGDGLEITLIREGNALHVVYGGAVLKTVEIDSEYANEKCRVAFYSCWGECEIPFEISDDFKSELDDITVTLTGVDALEHGAATLNKTGYKLCDKIVLNIVPEGNYKAIKVTVNDEDKTSALNADGTLMLGYAVADIEYVVDVTFDEPVTLTATVNALKIGETINLKGQTVTLVGSNGTFSGEVGENGAFSVENAYKGVYTAKLAGYLDAQVTFDGTTAPTVTFEYDRFEGSGGYKLTNQNKADASVFIGQQQHNYALTKDKYDDVSVTATFKSSYGSYKGFMGIQLVFDDGNGVMLVFECTNGDGNIHADQMKLCFGTDCWGAKYAITGNALTTWISVSEPLSADMATAFGGDGLEITLIREGNAMHVLYGGTVLKTIETDGKYAAEKCRVAFFSEWGECEIPFEISSAFKSELSDVTVTATGGDALVNGTATLNQASYKLCDAIVLNVTPESGYKLKNITVNGKDVTAQVADGRLLLGYATAEATYEIEATFIEDKPAYDVTFSYDTEKYNANGLVITLQKGDDTQTVTLGENTVVVSNLTVGEWAATAEFGGMTVSLGNFNIQVDEYFVDLDRVFDGSGAITGADFINNTFEYKMFVKSNEDFQPAFMTEATGIAEGNAFFMTKISLDAASQGVITSSDAWCVVRLFMQVGDSRQEIMLAYNHKEGAFRFIQLPGWTMTDLSADLKTAYESGDGIYVVWGYNAETGGMDIYAGTTKENVAKVGSFRADAFPKNGTVSAIGFGDGLWGNPDFSVTVELNYGATLNEALGLTE